MAAAFVDQGLTNFISCPVCLEEFIDKNPRVLSCLHVFCEDCLQNIIDHKKVTHPDHFGEIDCPFCKSTTVIPGGQAASLPIYFQFREIEDVRKQIRDRHVTCQICQTDTHKAKISSYCFTCSSGLCESCRVDHDSVSPDHEMIQISASAIKYMICQEHDCHLSYFCVTCCRAVCSKCRIKGHIKHEVHALTYHRQEAGEEFNKFVTSKLETVDKAINRLDRLQDEVDKNIKNLYTNLKEHRDKTIEIINNQYTSLCDELKVKRHDIQQGINKSRKYIEDIKKTLEKFKNDTKYWRQPIKEVPEATVTNLDHLMADVRKQIPATDVNIDIPPKLHFIPGTDDICLGEIVDMLGTDDICLGEIVEDLTSSSLSRKPTLMWKTKIQTKIQISPCVRDIEFIGNNHIIVVTHHKVLIFNENGEETRHDLSGVSKHMSCGSMLGGVSVNRDNSKVVFVDNQDWNVEGCLHVYLRHDGNWLYKELIVCKYPYWVRFTNCDEYLVFSFYDKKIYKYNQQGIQVMSLQMSDSISGLCVDHENRIIVWFLSKVCVYDEKGTKILTLQKQDTHLFVRDICASHDDNILVCDEESKSVLLFDKNGVFIKNLLTLNDSPEKICLYKSKYLAVSDQSDNLSLYKL